MYRDKKIVIAVSNLGKRVKPLWELLLRKQSPKEDFDRLFKEAVVALLVSPEDFYRTLKSDEEIENMFRSFTSNT